MRTVRRLFHADILSAVFFVGAAFIALFFFIDLVDEIGDVGKQGYTLLEAVVYTILRVPGHVYELIPIAVLIGTIFALARLAQTSQYTILRTSGLGPARALGVLAGIALLFALATFVVGDYLAPATERVATQLRGVFTGGGLRLQRSGAWIKERATTPQGPRNYSINVASAEGGNALRKVRIFEFDGDGRLRSRIAATDATIGDDGVWHLRGVTVSRWPDPASADPATVHDQKLPALDWRSTLSPSVVAAALLPISTMSTLELYRYIDHLSDNEQASQGQKIQFWKRALYPFACFVMVALALPFAYLSTRSGGVSLKVFVGIMIGASFVLLDAAFGHLGLLGSWTPWLVAAAPGALYLVLSLAAFSWLVRHR